MKISSYRNTITVDGVRYSRKGMAVYLGLSKQAVDGARYRTDLDGFILWLRKKLWLKSSGYDTALKVFMSPDGDMTTIPIIRSMSGCSRAQAGIRGKHYEKGEIGEDKLYKPVSGHNEGNKVWQAMGYVPRDENLGNTPMPTYHDVVVKSQFVGQCLPGLENNDMKRY